MPIFEEEKMLDLPVEGQNVPKPALGSPAYAPYPSPPALSSAGMLFGGAGREDDNLSRRGLTNDQLSKIATMPSKDTGPNLIPLSEVAANKRYNTYVRGVDLENIYGLQQSWYEQLGNSAIKFAGLTAGSFAQSFATLPNMISTLKSGSAAERLARLSGDPDGYEAKIDNWTRNMEDIFPNYMTRRERENPMMGIIPFMPGSANFWGEGILKNLGFTVGSIAGAIAQDAIIGTVTGGVGALPVAAAQIGKASLWLNKILAGTNKIDAALDLGKAVGASSKAILSAKNLGQAAEGIRTLDKVRYGLVLTGSARTESAIESRDSYRVLKDELTKEYVKKNGVEPEGEALREIENYATAGMNTRFGVNMALLTLSNTIQFGNMFKSFTTSSSQLANTVTRNIDDLGKVRLKDGSLDVFEKVVPETRIGKIWESVRPTVKNVFAEGVYEEGGQFAAEKGVYDYYTRKYKNLSNPDNANTWNSLNEAVDSTVKGLNEQFGSGEGVQNMVVGAITALITGKAMGAIQKKMGVPTDDEKLQSTLSIINNYGLTGILSQQYSDVAASAGIAREMDEAVKEGNIFKYNNLKKDLFFNYVSSRIPIGMHDVTVEQLKMLKTLDKEEFEKTFGMSFDASSKKTVNDYVDNLILQANQIKDITDSLDATFKNPYKFNINAKEDTEDFVNNLNYQAFNSWKRDLAYYAYEVPADNQRIASIQQTVAGINPSLSTSLLSDLTNKDSLKSLSKEYELEAARIEKGITDMMPVAAAREIRANARALRTLSERINLAINNNTANDTKLFNDVLNFELTSRNPKAEKIIGLEKATELFNYGVDINLINNRKEIARDKYEYLSSEKGFFEYMEEEQQVNEDLQKEAPEETPKEETAILPPTTPKYKDVAGVEQPLEQGRTYEIAPFKKPTINKIADNRYEVVSPDGKSTFYNNEEDAKEALDELSQKLKALESVKVLAFNPDGTIKIEDINGDVYNIPAGSLDGYSKRETEQEKLARNKEEVDNLQKEIDNNSPTVATEEYPLKEGYQKDIEEGSTAIDEIDFKKSWKYLFWSTTSASEIRDVDSKKPHAVRAISFLQKAKEFPNRGALRVMLVTPYQEEAMGLRGITKLSTGEDPKSNVTDFDNEVIFAVYVEQKDGKLFFVGQDGNIIGAVGEQVDMDKVVFNTMPTTALTWGAGGQEKARYRGKEEREAKIMSARWGVKRKEMFEATKKSPDVPEVYSFQISLGIPVIDSMEDRNPVAKSLFDPSLKNGDKIIRNEEGLLQVSTTGMISHQGVNYKVPKGQIRISYGDMLAPAVNNKLGKNKATAIFEVLKAMAEDMMEKSKKKQKIKFPIDYEEFIINTLYWRKSPDTKKSNQIFIDDEMNIVIGGKKYDITNLESYRKEIIDNLSDAYHIVNNKSLGSAVEGGVSKFRRPFIEYFVDKDGKLQNREWTNYQTYLLSDKLPDGSARSSSEIPVTTFIRSITEALPYNFVQKYSILQPTGFVNLPIPAEEKKAPTPTPPPTPTAPAKIVVDGNEIVADGKTLNTSTKAFKSGNPVQYTITIDDDGKVKSVLVDANNQTSNTIKDVAETPAMLQAVDNALKQGNAYDEKLSPVARVALFAASKIKLYFEQELAKAPAPTAAVLQPDVSPLAQAQGTARTEPVVTAVSTEAARADIERRRKEELTIDNKLVYETGFDRSGKEYPGGWLQHQNEVNAKYDAELAALKETKVDIEKLKQTPEGKQIEEEKQKTIRSVRMVKDMLGAAVYEFEVRGKKDSVIGDQNTLYSYIDNIYNTELAALEEVKPAEAPAAEEVVPVKKNKGGKFKKRDSPAARVIGKKEKVKPKISEYDIELFKQYHSEVASNVPYEIAERIFILHDGERAYGVFENGVAKFYKGAIRGTEYHELFEGIWKAFLTSEERQEILDELKALPGTFTDRASGKKLRWDEATDKQIKERIADDFAEYRLGKLPARTLLEKIVRFFKNIINYFRNMVSAPKSRKEKLFRDIDAGRFKDFKISDEVRMDEMVEASAVEGLIESDVKKFVQDISAEIFSYIFSNNKSLFELSKITNEEVYNHVKSLYIFEDRLNDEDPDALSTKQFNEVFQRVYDFIRTFRIEFDDENLSYVNDSDANNRNYAPEPFSTDWKKQSPYPVKLLIGTLIKTDPTSVDALTGLAEAKLSEGINGFQLIDFGRAFAMMLDKLSNTTSIKDFGKKLSQIAKFSTDYGRLLVRLKTNKETGFIDFESMSLDDMRLFIQTYQTFAAKQKPLALIQYVSGDAVRTGAANLFTAVREKKEDWLSNLRMIAKDKESIVKFDADQKTYFVKDLKGIPVSSVEEKIEFLKKMGIEFPMSTYVKLKSVKEPTERRSDKDKFGDAVNSIYEYVGKNEGIGTISGKTLKVDGPLSTLATLYVSYENPAQETTRFNVENKRVNEYTENNLPSVFENDFSESETLEELKARRPELNDEFTTHSVILKKGGLFYDQDGEKIGKVKVGYIEGVKDANNSKNTTTSRLSESDRLVLQLNQNINGRYYIILPADGSTEWLLSIGSIIGYEKIAGGRAWDEVYKIFQGYLKDEIELAKSDRSYLVNTAPRAKELRFFKEILSGDLLNKVNSLILDNATRDTINKFIEDNSSDINDAVKSFIEEKVERVSENLISNKKVEGSDEIGWSFELLDSDFAEQFKINKNSITKEELNNILTFANMNYIIANIEMHKVLFGDPYQFKIKDNILDELKRIKSSLSPRRTTVDSPEINNKLNKEHNTVGDKIPLLPGESGLPDTPGYHDHKSFVTTATLYDVNIVGSLANVNPSYVKTNETDGFSIIMDGTYREVKEKNGQWTPQADKWHNWQMSYTRKRLDEKGVWKYPEDGKLKAYDEKILSKPAPSHIVEVLKPIVTGNKANRNRFDQVIDKFSQMPLYYSMVEGRNLEDLYIKMWKEKIGYVVYESGRKEGIEEKIHPVYLSDGKFNPEPFNNRIEVPWKAYGVQVETSYDDFKEDVSMGSQPTKIISIDLFENAVPVSAKAGDEYQRNVRILNDIHKHAYYQLLKKMGIEDLGNGFKIVDRKALSKSLEHEILRRELSQNVADTVRLNKDGQFPIPFEASNSYIQIRDVIFSMIDKALISKKMHGGAFVQTSVTMWEDKGKGRSLVKKEMVYNDKVISMEEYEKLSKDEQKNVKFRYDKISSAEYEKLSDKEKKLVSLTSDTLKMPTPEDPFMEVMLPHWFREKLPSKLKRMSDDQLLSHLNTTEDGKKLLQAFGFRIPTQALSSMSAIRVAGFLPQYMGYTVVVPSEITTMAGSDFDIDKMFIYLKSYYVDKNDNIRLVKYLDSEEATKEFFTNLYESRMNDELDKITRFEEFREKLIDILNSIQQLDDTSLEQLETLSDEDFEFYTNHAVLINEIIDQAEEEQTTPKDYILEQIKRLGEKKEKFTEKLLNTDLKEKYVERMYRRALENEYFDSMINLITLPEAYDRLISPVDDAGLKDVAGEIEKLRGDSELDEKGNPRVKGRLLDMSFMNNLRHAFITAKRWVGIAAVNITGLSVAQKSKVYIDTRKLSYLDEADKKFLGDGSIALPHNKVTIDGRTYASFSGTKTADGKGRYISSRLSGYLTTFVDVAKDPYIMKIIRSELLISTAMFLERIGAGEYTPLFINQPIIVEYVKYLENNDKRSLFSKAGLEMVQTMFPASQTAIDNASIDVSIDAMKDNIESYYKKGTFTEEQNAKQLLIFEEFLKYAKMAQHSFKLNMATNYDTSKFRSAGILIRKIFRTQSAKRKNIFSSVDDILKNSHIGLQAQFIESAVMATGEYLQLNKPEILENAIIPVLQPYIENEYLNEEDFMKMEMMVTSSFLDYLQQTKTKINEEVRMLTTDESTSVAKMLRDAKVKYPDNELLQNLSVRQKVEGGPMTVKLLANNKSSGIDENYYIGMMRELRDNPDTEALYRGLVKLSIIQGSHQSAVSIKNIIPVEDYSDLLKDKLMNIRYSEQEMDAFKDGMFHRNNWRNERVFKKAYPNFIINPRKQPIMNEDGEPMYEYFSFSFPIVPTISAERKNNLILTLSEKYNSKEAGSEYVLVDRLLKKPKGDFYVDIATGDSYSMSDYRRLIAKGNAIAKQVYGYQLVKYQDGTPVVTYDKDGNMSYVYKLINLYADAPNVYEYYTDFIESKIPNNSAKIKNEVDNDLIYKYFEGVNEKKNPKAPAKQEQVDDAPFDVDEAVETTSVSTIRKEIQPGFYNHGFLSKEDEKIILDEAIKQTNQQGYPVKSSVVYAHWGNMWAVTDKGADAFPVFGKYLKRSQESAGLGKGLKKIDLPKSNIQHNDGGKGWYDYYPTDQNGVPLPPIPQVVKDILEKKLGMDMSVYDSAIINSYGETTELSRHIDNTEDKGYAYKIPIVSISLIGDSIFQYSDPSENPNHSLPDKHAIGLKPGQVVVFGGPSRAMAHRVLNGRSGASVNIKNSVGYLKTERINITLRRALPLSKEEYDAWMRRSEELKQETPPTPAPTPLTSMSEITNHSGGAALSDTEWDQIGREYGVINHFHYREPLDYIDTKGEPAKGSKTLDSKRLQAAGITPTYISQKDYDEGAAKATKAFRMMYKDSEYKSVRSAYIIRNWMQVKNADAVFAIGTIKQPGENASDKADETRIAAIPIIKGGTGYAVQMAINEGKPVYVFDGTKAGWYKYDYNSKTFVPTETPTLTKNFAGIGSRTLGTQEVINKSIQAIRDVYEKTKNSISTAPTAPVSTQLFDPSLPKINIYAGTGENAELSNFANRPFISSYHGDLQFNTVEGAYQSAKLNFTNSKKYWESPGQITNTTEALFDKFQKATGSIAKSLGQTIEGLDVKKWDANSSRIMKDLLKQSFEQNPQALQKLLATGNAELTHTQESPKSKWRTEFPKLLMEVRQELREVSPVTETKTFEEFGTQYRFTLENGVAVKGEFKQGGKDWQEMNAKNVGKKYAELSQKPVVKTPPVEEPPVSIGENTFTFSDGTVINTGNIKLNAQQEVALQLAVNAINRKQTKFVLSGYAGTGKSTISKFIREYLQQSKSFKNIVYSSPTHKANVNLLLQLLRGKIFNVIPSTVATVLNKRKIDNEWVPGPRNKMPSNGVLIVDESSMINDEDYRLLTNLAKSKNSSIIFMGDPAQLPPVSSNEISKAMQFSTPEEGIELTQVMRQQGDNPLLDVLTNIRDNLKSKTDTFSFVSNVNSKGEGISFTKDFNHFNEKINEYFSSKEYKEDPTYAKILTYTNASVANYNDMIQNLLGLEPYSPNSIMMGYEQVGTSSMINNGQDYIILNSEYVSNQPVKVFKGNILNRSFDIQSEVSGYKVTLRKVFSKEDEEILLDNGQSNIIVPIEIFIINPNDDNNIDFMKKVLSFKQVLNDYTIPWSARENAVTEFENFFNIYQFPADMINYKGTITTLQKLKEDNPKLFKLNPTTGTSEFQETGLSERTVLPKNIDYGYAVTSHKGQGSTYKYIFADLQNMDNPANLRIIKDKGKDFAIERQQLKYVGLSRASVEVFAYTRKTNESTLKEGKVIKEAALSQPSAFDLLTEFTPERKQEILSNFAYKHKMTIEKAKDYINEAIATKGKEIVIAQLNKTDEQGNKCY